MHTKHFYLFFLLLSVLFSACRNEQKEIVILFDNDVHCAMDFYPKMAELRRQALLRTPYAAVVSAGDFVQGDAVGSLSNGEYVVDVMNAVPYDYVTLGNHEFDYGMQRQKRLVRMLKAQTLCCNFSRTDGTDPYPAFAIRRYGKLRIAFVGAATPTSYTSSTPSFFCDGEGNRIYDFHPQDTFDRIQQAVNEARRKGADIVILLSHLGDDSTIARSGDMIRATTGIDAVLDGHAHHFLNLRIPDMDGDTVMLLSTGARGTYIGRLTVTPDCRLVPEFLLCDTLASDPVVEEKVAQARRNVKRQTEAVVGYSEVTLTDKDCSGNRLVRRGETNLSRFVADAMRNATATQIGAIHGGSLRAAIHEGDITLGDIIALLPFNNHAAAVSITGQQLLDAVEVSVARWPEENGDFHIFSHLRYTIDPSIPSSVIFDENELFCGVGETRRIVSMEVALAPEDPALPEHLVWAPIDPKATYTVGGLDYTLLNHGASGMFRHAERLYCPDMKDTEMLVTYLRNLGDTVRRTDYPLDFTAPRFMLRGE